MWQYDGIAFFLLVLLMVGWLVWLARLYIHYQKKKKKEKKRS
jgi:hypothetical protein